VAAAAAAAVLASGSLLAAAAFGEDGGVASDTEDGVGCGLVVESGQLGERWLKRSLDL